MSPPKIFTRSPIPDQPVPDAVAATGRRARRRAPRAAGRPGVARPRRRPGGRRACLRVLVSPSCTMRYAERSSPGGRATGLPRRRAPRRARRPARRRRAAGGRPAPGCGASSSWSSARAASRRAAGASPRARSGRPARRSAAPPGPRSLGGHPVPHRPDLEDHHADRVGDDVVELAGDPRPLLGHRDAGPPPRAPARPAPRAPRRPRSARSARAARSRPASRSRTAPG